MVFLLVVGPGDVGGYAFFNVNVEAYPDPAPAIIEVVAQFPRAAAEEVERQVTIPLEVALAGMPGLKYTRAQSMFGLAHFRNQFEYGIDYERGPAGSDQPTAHADVPRRVMPQISPASPIGEILRYTLDQSQGCHGAGDLHAQRFEVVAGLDAGARVPPRAAHCRRGQHGGWQVKRYEDSARPRPPQGIRHHARPTPKCHRQQQCQRRRQLRGQGGSMLRWSAASA